MKQNSINAPKDSAISPSSFLKHQILVIFSLVTFLLCILFLGPINETHSKTSLSEDMVITQATTTSTIPSTKWWIKPTATTSPSILLTQNVTKVATDTSARNCSLGFSSPSGVGTYAYISLVPPHPNRVRAGAGRSTPYLGQIQPGAGVKIIDGPLCADGLSWWLVETVESELRGWTVAGSTSEQWVLPCPNPAVACKMSPVIQSATPTSTHSSTKGNNDHICTSNGFFIGMSAQIKEDNLLVVRSEPYIGSVLGHAGPTSAVMIVDGPACAGGAVWWEVNIPSLNLTGWATEASLRPCTQEDDCT